MAPSITKQLASIQKSFDALLSKTAKTAKRSKKIDDCTSKKELAKFTIKELTEWIKKNKMVDQSKN